MIEVTASQDLGHYIGKNAHQREDGYLMPETSLDGLVTYIVQCKYIPFSQKTMDKKHPELPDRNRNLVLESLTEREEEEERWLKGELQKAMKPDGKLHLSGFLLFCYQKHLEQVIDELVIEASAVEYDDFLEGLRIMIPFLTKKEEEVHIFLREKGFLIRINPKEEVSVSFEKPREYYLDIVLNLLIAAVPKKIVLHRSDSVGNRSFLRQIFTVFGECCVFCDGCDHCRH